MIKIRGNLKTSQKMPDRTWQCYFDGARKLTPPDYGGSIGFSVNHSDIEKALTLINISEFEELFIHYKDEPPAIGFGDFDISK